MRLRYALIIFLSLLSTTILSAVNVEKRLDITTGLAHNGVACTIKDHRGYLWIGTYDGLNRFDGAEITIYKNSVGKELFQSNRIRTISEDQNGLLWIGTDEGVTLLDYERHIFTQLSHPDHIGSPMVRKTFIDNDRVICIGEEGAILIYDLSGELIRCDVLPQSTTINSAIHYNEEQYVLAGLDGLIMYDAKSGHTQKVHAPLDREISAIAKYDNGTLLISYSYGVQRISIDSQYNTVELSDILYDSIHVISLAINHDESVWMGCEKHPAILANSFGGSLKVVLDEWRVSGFLFDSDGVYVSTFDDGVVWLSTQEPIFTLFGNDKIPQPYIIPLDDDRIIASTTSYLTTYNTTTKSEEPLPFEIDNHIAANHNFFLKDNSDQLWIISTNNSYRRELYRVDGKKTTRLNSDKLSLIDVASKPIEAIYDGYDDLWIAYSNNLYRVQFDNLGSGEITNVESIYTNKILDGGKNISRTRALYYDDVTNALWVGTNKSGLFKINLSSPETPLCDLKVKNYTHDKTDQTSLSVNFVSAILRTKSGVLWIGTEQGGLCRATESGDDLTFETLSEDDGLSNNVIKGIREDQRGNLWIGTNIGLNKYIVDKNRFFVYRSDNGVLIEGFWYHTLSLGNGKFAFSGTNNILTFDPNDLYQYRDVAKIYFDRLSINNTIIQPNEEYNGSVIFDRLFRDGDTLNLKYNQNTFSLGVDIIGGDNTIYYKLSPTNEEWIKMESNSRDISFNGLNPGKYRLYISAPDSMGEIGDNSTFIHINITPPIWKSTSAYILYMLILVFIIGVVIYALMSFQSINHRLQIRTIEKGVNEDKLRYFSNISHELKTPLSLILAPVAMLRERFSIDREVTNKLDLIKRQSQKLLELIELTHGIEANDLNNLTPKKALFSFEKMIRDITIDFEFITSYDNKIFRVDSADQPIAAEGDRAMIEKVISNLLSNALKHTTSGDEIILSYTVKQDRIILCVKDSGYGIGAKDLPHIFERFYQARRSGANNIGGTGIGLTFSKMLVELHNGTITVESELNIGTAFTVSLPIVVDKEILEEQTPTALVGEIINDASDTEIVVKSEYASSVVYLVEDNQELRLLLCEIIGRYFQVKGYGSGLELLSDLENEWPDLIVSDVMMPEMDGYELCQRVKEDIKTSHIPVILLTACSTVDDRIKGLSVGADAYIPKPFYPKHLITRIETLLYNRQQLRERFQIGIPLVYGKDGNNSAKDNEFMHQLYELFNANLSNEEINLDLIARDLGQNRSMFFKKVKSITNSSPYELLKEYRLTKAAELLQSGKYNVGEICVLTGFKDRSHFSRRFKEQFNVSPSRYVSMHRSE